MVAFTPPEIFAGIIAIIGLILTGLNIIDKITALSAKAKEPELAQDQRITALEDEVKEIKSKLNNDNERITRHEESERIMMKALKALLSHGIDGNNTEEMSKAASALDNYLIEK